MHPRFATATTGPLGFGPNKPNTGAAGVVMHLPFGRKKLGYIIIGKKVRCAVGTVDYSQLPLVGDGGF